MPIYCLLFRVASRSVQFVAIRTFAMKHCSSITATQQLFTDTTSTLVAYIQHKSFLLQVISAFSLKYSSNCADYARSDDPLLTAGISSNYREQHRRRARHGTCGASGQLEAQIEFAPQFGSIRIRRSKRNHAGPEVTLLGSVAQPVEDPSRSASAQSKVTLIVVEKSRQPRHYRSFCCRNRYGSRLTTNSQR